MKVLRVPQATSDIERLRKKHPELWTFIEQFERLLAHGQTHGHDRYPGLRLSRVGNPASIWKARVIYPPLGGKRSGLRYVYERLTVDDEEYAVALAVYVHQEGDKEHDIRARLVERSTSFEATKEGLKTLERANVD